jgi:hypothetical protein
MKNLAASSGAALFEKKKSYGLFSWYYRESTAPPPVVKEVNRPKAPPRTGKRVPG